MIARTEVDILETRGKLVRRILEITDGVPNGPDIVTTLFKNRINLEKLKQTYAPMLAMDARIGRAW